MNQQQVKRWMAQNWQEYVDSRTGEGDATGLAEAAAAEADHMEWLDEDTHWVWDLAASQMDKAAPQRVASDTNLRVATIRLAASLPENSDERRQLLSALRKSAAEDWVDVLQGSQVRIRWSRWAILIEEMPRKGAKHLRKATYHSRNYFGTYGSDAFLVANLLRDMKPAASMTYDSAVSALKYAILEALNTYDDPNETWANQKADPISDYIRKSLLQAPVEDSVYFLEVEPADYKDLVVEGRDFSVQATWNRFRAYSPNSDFQQSDPHYTLYESSSAGAARKFYKTVKANPQILQGITWGGFSDWLRKNEIKYDTRFSDWR